MRALTLDELDAEAVAFDAEVARAGEHGHFCSSSFWVLPAARELMPAREPWTFGGPFGYVAMMRGRHAQGFRYVEPLEASWGLACPLVGRDPGALAGAFLELVRDRAGDWDVLVVSGMIQSDPLTREVARGLARRYDLRVGPGIRRWVARLDGGLDGFLSRRSAATRRNLRRALRRTDVELVDAPADPDAAFDRVLAVEARSWKGHGGVGIDAEPTAAFYRAIVRRLAARGALRLRFARRDDADVGYILGGVVARSGGTSYRGLQFSFDAEHAPEGIGNLMQIKEIEQLCAAGVAEYDLGATGDHYKRRWAERTIDHRVLLARRR